MRLAHTITVKMFADDAAQVQEFKGALAKFLPPDLEKERIAYAQERCNGFEERAILVVTLTLTKESHTNLFLRRLRAMLSRDALVQLSTQDNRLDDELNFFIRLFKPEFLAGRYALTDSGNCVHIRVHVAAFPAAKAPALAVMRNLFNPDQAKEAP